jgi:hypothetical protein
MSAVDQEVCPYWLERDVDTVLFISTCYANDNAELPVVRLLTFTPCSLQCDTATLQVLQTRYAWRSIVRPKRETSASCE